MRSSVGSPRGVSFGDEDANSFITSIGRRVGQHSVVELGVTSRPQGATGRSALARECNDPCHPVDGVVFDATRHILVIGRSHSRNSGHAPVLLRYSCDSSRYFRRLAINLIIRLRTYS